MFNEDYVTFPRDDIAKLSGLTMPVNKRNWRKQEDHLRRARAVSYTHLDVYKRQGPERYSL